MDKTSKIDRMLLETPTFEMINCKPEDEKGNPISSLIIQSSYSKGFLPSNIPKERIAGLKNLFYKNSRKAIEELIQYRFLDREILGTYQGKASVILPIGLKQFHRECVSFETRGYQIYFNDFAIPIFQNTIFKLNQKSKRDSLHFIKTKIESREASQLHLSVSPSFDDTRSRMSMHFKNHGIEDALYYYASLKQDGTLEDGDLANILELIEVFAGTYGEFETINQTDTGCVATNTGSLKITGIDKIPDPLQKVYSLKKREE